MTRRSDALGLTLDAGGLIAVERGDERMIALIRTARHAELPIVVPAGVLAQVWRDGRKQARLSGFLRTRRDAPILAPLDGPTARAAGELCGHTSTTDVVDASVLLCARSLGHHIVTSDPRDMTRLDPGAPVIVV